MPFARHCPPAGYISWLPQEDPSVHTDLLMCIAATPPAGPPGPDPAPTVTGCAAAALPPPADPTATPRLFSTDTLSEGDLRAAAGCILLKAAGADTDTPLWAADFPLEPLSAEEGQAGLSPLPTPPLSPLDAADRARDRAASLAAECEGLAPLLLQHGSQGGTDTDTHTHTGSAAAAAEARRSAFCDALLTSLSADMRCPCFPPAGAGVASPGVPGADSILTSLEVRSPSQDACCAAAAEDEEGRACDAGSAVACQVMRFLEGGGGGGEAPRPLPPLRCDDGPYQEVLCSGVFRLGTRHASPSDPHPTSGSPAALGTFPEAPKEEIAVPGQAHHHHHHHATTSQPDASAPPPPPPPPSDLREVVPPLIFGDPFDCITESDIIASVEAELASRGDPMGAPDDCRSGAGGAVFRPSTAEGHPPCGRAVPVFPAGISGIADAVRRADSLLGDLDAREGEPRLRPVVVLPAHLVGLPQGGDGGVDADLHTANADADPPTDGVACRADTPCLPSRPRFASSWVSAELRKAGGGGGGGGGGDINGGPRIAWPEWSATALPPPVQAVGSGHGEEGGVAPGTPTPPGTPLRLCSPREAGGGSEGPAEAMGTPPLLPDSELPAACRVVLPHLAQPAPHPPLGVAGAAPTPTPAGATPPDGGSDSAGVLLLDCTSPDRRSSRTCMPLPPSCAGEAQVDALEAAHRRAVAARPGHALRAALLSDAAAHFSNLRAAVASIGAASTGDPRLAQAVACNVFRERARLGPSESELLAPGGAARLRLTQAGARPAAAAVAEQARMTSVGCDAMRRPPSSGDVAVAVSSLSHAEGAPRRTPEPAQPVTQPQDGGKQQQQPAAPRRPTPALPKPFVPERPAPRKLSRPGMELTSAEWGVVEAAASEPGSVTLVLHSDSKGWGECLALAVTGSLAGSPGRVVWGVRHADCPAALPGLRGILQESFEEVATPDSPGDTLPHNRHHHHHHRQHQVVLTSSECVAESLTRDTLCVVLMGFTEYTYSPSRGTGCRIASSAFGAPLLRTLRVVWTCAPSASVVIIRELPEAESSLMELLAGLLEAAEAKGAGQPTLFVKLRERTCVRPIQPDATLSRAVAHVGSLGAGAPPNSPQGRVYAKLAQLLSHHCFEVAAFCIETLLSHATARRELPQGCLALLGRMLTTIQGKTNPRLPILSALLWDMLAGQEAPLLVVLVVIQNAQSISAVGRALATLLRDERRQGVSVFAAGHASGSVLSEMGPSGCAAKLHPESLDYVLRKLAARRAEAPHRVAAVLVGAEHAGRVSHDLLARAPISLAVDYDALHSGGGGWPYFTPEGHLRPPPLPAVPAGFEPPLYYEASDASPSPTVFTHAALPQALKARVVAGRLKFAAFRIGRSSYGDAYVHRVARGAPGGVVRADPAAVLRQFREVEGAAVTTTATTPGSFDNPTTGTAPPEAAAASPLQRAWVVPDDTDDVELLQAMDGFPLLRWSHGAVSASRVCVVRRPLPPLLNAVFTSLSTAALVEPPDSLQDVSLIERKLEALAASGITKAIIVVLVSGEEGGVVRGSPGGGGMRVGNSDVAFAYTHAEAVVRIASLCTEAGGGGAAITDGLVPFPEAAPAVACLTWGDPLCDTPLRDEALLLHLCRVTAATSLQEVKAMLQGCPAQPPHGQHVGRLLLQVEQHLGGCEADPLGCGPGGFPAPPPRQAMGGSRAGRSPERHGDVAGFARFGSGFSIPSFAPSGEQFGLGEGGSGGAGVDPFSVEGGDGGGGDGGFFDAVCDRFSGHLC